jgi:archaellum component FlaC
MLVFQETDRQVTINRDGRVVIVGSDGQTQILPAGETPYYALKSKHDELQRQLENLTERRDDLADDLHARSGADREGVESRIKALDVQIQSLEKEVSDVGREVAAAAPAQLSVPQPRTIYRGFGGEDMVGAGFIGAGIMLVLCLPMIYRAWRRRKWTPAGLTSNQTPALPVERIDRMENAIESIAVEIERVSENQRFMTRLMTETQLAGTIAAVRGSTEAAKAAAEKASNV